MNPKIKIAVDAKNKAATVLEGLVTVGAKIDLEVTGLTETDIPQYEPTDKFVGRSLRVRVTDMDGHDLARFPLVEKDTTVTPQLDGDKWSVTSDVFTNESGTCITFDTDVLRKAFCGVPYNETLEFGLILDSIIDSAEYALGKIKVRQWAVASTEDPTVLPDWRATLAQLTADLASVEASKMAAENAAAQAGTYATNASTSASEASASASAASGSESRAAVSVRHYPQVGLNGNWWVWDVDAGQFVDSGKSACGYASWFFDLSDNKYHKVVITVNSLGEHCISVDQDGVSSVPAGDQYVDSSTNQTIGGVKTFTSSPIVPAPSNNTDAATKKYVDDSVSPKANDNAVVKLTGNQTIADVKTFTSSPIIPTLDSTDDNSTKSASTGWVTAKLVAWWNAIKGAAVSFSNSVTASGGFIGDLTGDVTGDVSGNATTATTATTALACSGNSATATKLSTSRSLNVKDADETNAGTAASFDGSGNAIIKLPATIKASLTGHASQDAYDSSVVKLTGSQTIGGVKTFTSSPIVPTPSNNTDAATKKYVDDSVSPKANDSDVVKLTGDQTIGGKKTFSSIISSSDDLIKRSVNTGYLAITGGTVSSSTLGEGRGARLYLYGGDNSSGLGSWGLTANNGTSLYNLFGSSGGKLSWGGTSVVGSAFAAVGMPSGSYLSDLIELSNGARFEAPYNGWLVLAAYTNSSNGGYMRLYGINGIGSSDRSSESGTLLQVFCPAKKGQIVALYCNNITTGQYSVNRFIKADAEVA